MQAASLGDELDAVINGWKWNQVSETQSHFLIGLENYFNKCLNYYTNNPVFLITGTITSGPSSIPCVGAHGTFASYTIIPMQLSEWRGIITPVNNKAEIPDYKFYVRLSKIIQIYFTKNIILFIDAKGIGASTPLPITPMTFLANNWGNIAQRQMDAKRPNNHDDWISMMNTIGDLIWKNFTINTTVYSSPCSGGLFTGSYTLNFGLFQ